MPKITHVGDNPYSGYDHGNAGKLIDIAPGETVEVSTAKAEQLLADFPDWFKKARGGKSEKTPPATHADLVGGALRDFAEKRGLKFPADADDDTIRAALIADESA